LLCSLEVNLRAKRTNLHPAGIASSIIVVFVVLGRTTLR